MVRMSKLAVLAFAAALGLAVPALSDALPDKGPNGGMLGEAGEHHIELVVSGQALTVHLLDHKNKPVAEAGLTGTAVVTGEVDRPGRRQAWRYGEVSGHRGASGGCQRQRAERADADGAVRREAVGAWRAHTGSVRPPGSASRLFFDTSNGWSAK
jgi:hypothetical protein